jgi:hypothetical protein
MRILGQHLLQTGTPSVASTTVLETHAPRRVGSYYGSTFGCHHQNSEWGANDVTHMNGSRVSMIYVGRTVTWSEMRQRVLGTGDNLGVFRWSIYSTDNTTLFPSALLFDSGDIAYNFGGPVDKAVGISVQTTSNWVMVASTCVGKITGPIVLAQSVSLSGTNFTGFYPFGVDVIPATATTMPNFLNFGTVPGGIPRGAAPAPGDFTLRESMSGITQLTCDSGIWLKLGSIP